MEHLEKGHVYDVTDLRREYIEAQKELTKVPQITDPLGKHWDQPSRHKVFIGTGYASMSKASFKQLPEYSTSIPSGTYTGKMWKRDNYRNDVKFWQLCWYGAVRDKMIDIHYRNIIVL